MSSAWSPSPSAWKAAKQAGKAWPYPVREVWHNSFERISNAKDINAVTASVTASAGAAVDRRGRPRGGRDRGQRGAPRRAQGPRQRRQGQGAARRSRGARRPTQHRLRRPSGPAGQGAERALSSSGRSSSCTSPRRWPSSSTTCSKEFAKELKPDAALAAYTDGSVPNLSSIAALASFKGKTILLTGDARGDFLREGLRQEGLLDAAGKLHVDVFKLPHHGSDRNIDRDFFRDVTADHYVASADGTFVNPDRPTLEMLIESRPKDARLHDPPHLRGGRDRRPAPQGMGNGARGRAQEAGEESRARRSATNGTRRATASAPCSRRSGRRAIKFKVNAPPGAGRWPKIDLLDPIGF